MNVCFGASLNGSRRSWLGRHRAFACSCLQEPNIKITAPTTTLHYRQRSIASAMAVAHIAAMQRVAISAGLSDVSVLRSPEAAEPRGGVRRRPLRHAYIAEPLHHTDRRHAQTGQGTGICDHCETGDARGRKQACHVSGIDPQSRRYCWESVTLTAPLNYRYAVQHDPKRLDVMSKDVIQRRR